MRKLILFFFVVFLPAVVVGISNFHVFPDSSLPATLMLLTTVGVAGVFTWQSGNATEKIRRYCIVADVIIALILCLNLGAHWLLGREISAARQGVEERHAEEDRELQREKEKTELQIARDKSAADLARAEARRLAQLPLSQRRAQPTPKSEPTKAPEVAVAASVSAPIAPTLARMAPDQVRDSWWWKLTALAFAECFASVLAGAILAGVWEWDRNRDGIPDHLQQHVDTAAPDMEVTQWPRWVQIRDGRWVELAASPARRADFPSEIDPGK